MPRLWSMGKWALLLTICLNVQAICYLNVPYTIEGEHCNTDAARMNRAHMKVWRTNGVYDENSIAVLPDFAKDFQINYMGVLDGREAVIYKDGEDLIIDDDRVRLEFTATRRGDGIWWDIVINSRWDYSCKLNDVCQDIGLLCHVFIDEDKLRIAQSSTSICKTSRDMSKLLRKKLRVHFESSC